jgi:hypothetical protein
MNKKMSVVRLATVKDCAGRAFFATAISDIKKGDTAILEMKTFNSIIMTPKDALPTIKKHKKTRTIKLMDALDLLDEMAEESVQGNINLQVKKGLAYNLLMEFIHSK